MTHEIDVRRQWDGIEQVPVVRRLISAEEESKRRIANLLTPEPREYNVMLIVLPAAVIGIALFFYATNVLWVRQ